MLASELQIFLANIDWFHESIYNIYSKTNKLTTFYTKSKVDITFIKPIILFRPHGQKDS